MVDEAAFEKWLNGERPDYIPSDWVGSPTKTSDGYRWDDPSDPGNSFRFFRGDPSDPDPTHQEPFVIVIKGGRVLDKDAQPIADPDVVAHALSHE